MMALDSFLKIYNHAEFLVLQVFIYNHYFLQSNYLKLMNLGSLQILLLILSKIRSEIWSETWIFSLCYACTIYKHGVCYACTMIQREKYIGSV